MATPMTDALTFARQAARVDSVQAAQGITCTKTQWKGVVEDALDKLRAIRRWLVARQPFAASLVLRLAVRVTMRVQTMATDGRYLVINPQFIEDLSIEHGGFVLAHEALHCSLGHPWRKGNRDHRLWNVACDLVVNGLLVSAGFDMLQGCLYDHKYIGWSAEEVYADLTKRQDKGEGTPERQPDDQTADHDEWDEDREVWPYDKEDEEEDEQDEQEGQEGQDSEQEEDEEEEDTEGCDGQDNDSEEDEGDEWDEDEDGWDDDEEEDGESYDGQDNGDSEDGEEDEGDEWDEDEDGWDDDEEEDGESYDGQDNGDSEDGEEDDGEEAEPWAWEDEEDGTGEPIAGPDGNPAEGWKEVMAEATAAAEETDTMPEAVRKAISAAESIVDWRQQLAAYLNRKAGDKARTDWSRMRKYRMPGGERYWLPRTKRQGVNVCAMIDVSGSVDAESRSQFVGELIKLLKEVKGSGLDMLLMTSRIEMVCENVRSEEDIPIDEIEKIDGGTRFTQGFKWVEDRQGSKKHDLLIVLTDGYLFSWPKEAPKGTEVLWVITVPGHYNQPWGKVIKLDPNK